MGLLGFIIFVIMFLTCVGAWVNTKIILEEIEKIKKHLGIPEDKPVAFPNPVDNKDDND